MIQVMLHAGVYADLSRTIAFYSLCNETIVVQCFIEASEAY